MTTAETITEFQDPELGQAQSEYVEGASTALANSGIAENFTDNEEAHAREVSDGTEEPVADIYPHAVSTPEEAAAYTELYAKLFPEIRSFFVRKGSNHTEAEDRAQETFIGVYRYWKNLHHADIKASVYTIAKHTGNNAWRRAQSRPQTQSPPETEAAMEWLMAQAGDVPHPSAEETAASRDLTSLKEALSGVPKEFRKAVVAVYIEGLSYEEYAALSGKPVGTVQSQLNRGKRAVLEAAEVGHQKDKAAYTSKDRQQVANFLLGLTLRDSSDTEAA